MFAQIFSTACTLCLLIGLVAGSAIGFGSAQPLGGTLAYSSSRHIYLMDTRRLVRHNLTVTATYSSQPVWSPDGKQIALLTFNGQDSDIAVMDSAGMQRRNLSNKPGTDMYPRWSPDGQQIAFLSFSLIRGISSIYLIPSAGGRVRLLAPEAYRDFYGNSHSWSPDSRYLVYVSREGLNYEVYRADALTGELYNLTQHPADDLAPQWSPQGDQIAFISNRTGDHDIFLMDVSASGQVRQLTFNDSADASPAWSPDGKQIAYLSFVSGAAELFALPLEAGEPRQLTYGMSPFRFAWSPDSEQIVFATGGGNARLHLIDLISGQITDLQQYGDYPSWLS